MARTVGEGFDIFLGWLTPTGTETQAAKSHRASLGAKLRTEFGMTNFFRTGSFGNGTSISGFSDVDYFAVIPPGNLKKNSSTSLAEVRSALENRFPQTGVRVDCPAVLAPFGTDASESTEIVPAYYIKQKDGFDIYGIPDCSGGWMAASPEAHNAYVRTINEQKGKRVKALVRLLKAWKYYRNVPISSFYLELRVAKYASDESTIVYGYDVRNVLYQLQRSGLAAMQDPMGVSGLIQPCRTTAEKEDALSKLDTAVTRATKAVEAWEADKVEQAFDWWQQLYNGAFPAY